MPYKSNLYAHRPNKTAAGMMKTWDRQKKTRGPKPVSKSSKHYPYADAHASDVGKLLVYGTCDRVNKLWSYKVTNRGGGNCPCCGQETRKYRLTDQGRRRLETLKKKKGTNT